MKSMRLHRCVILVVVLVLSIDARPANAQENIKISGEAFLDYFYLFSTLDEDVEVDHGFSYRRARLTADAKLSEQFSTRIRIETIPLISLDKIVPEPFVKDLYLKWNSALGPGHNLIFGISPTVAWVPAEKVWGYRSLARTLQHRAALHSSRDMGVKATGPVAFDGKLRYGFMVGNANSVRVENDKFKRVYGQLEYYPSKHITLTLGSKYQGSQDGHAYNVNGFAGYSAQRFRVGLEGFFQPKVFDDGRPNEDRYGVSGFVVVDATKKHSLILRADRVERPDGAILGNTVFALVGVAFRPHKNVQFIPNLRYLWREGETNNRVTGLITLWFKF